MTKHDMICGPSSFHAFPFRRAQKMLVVGDIPHWKAQGRCLPTLDGLRFIDLDALNKTVIDDHLPDIVFSPLFSPYFDAVDVAGVLDKLAYNGPYRAVSSELPDPELVRKEICGCAPNLDFDLVLLPALETQN